MPETIAYVENIGTLYTVPNHPELIRCMPEDFSKDDRYLPPPSLLPCFFDREGLKVAISRYKGIVALLKKGL